MVFDPTETSEWDLAFSLLYQQVDETERPARKPGFLYGRPCSSPSSAPLLEPEELEEDPEEDEDEDFLTLQERLLAWFGGVTTYRIPEIPEMGACRRKDPRIALYLLVQSLKGVLKIP